MDAILHALGEFVIKALPTFFLVIFLHLYLKRMFFKPMEKVLHERYEATEGARKAAESSLSRAAQKAAEYEAAIRNAKTEIYKDQDRVRRELQERRASDLKVARAHAEAKVAEAKAALASEAARLKDDLNRESETLAEQIAEAVLGRRAA